MRNKKLLSTVVATAMIATMAMPVMAADGEVDIDVTTKTGVLRVEVPTTMAVEVDQFEIANQGSQIASGKFDMTNKSEIAVKVDVTSTVTLGTGITLATGKDKPTGDQAWLAVAAMTGANSYDIESTADKTENAWDLSEANDNVATFDATNKTAKQTFYLEKATGSVSYKLAVPDTNNKVGESYAKFYKLTSISPQPTDEATLKAEVDKADVYAVATTDISKDGSTVTKIVKGSIADTSGSTWQTGTTYYTMDAEPSALASGSVYAYAAMGTAGAEGAAGFTYIGKLSDTKATWTKTDIPAIKIEYTITGVTASNYAKESANCTYGLYKERVAPTFETGDGVGQIKYTEGSGDDALDSITKIELTNTYGTFDGYNSSDAYGAATDEDGVITFDSVFMSFFTDGATIQAKVTYTTVGGETKDTTVSVKLQ